MLVLVSVVLFFVLDNVIFACLGNHNRAIGVIVALFFGSITLMPGFIAYPLCGILLEKGGHLHGPGCLFNHPDDGGGFDLSH